MSDIFSGDIGTLIQLNVGVDISTATVTKIRVKTPDKSIVLWTATIGPDKMTLNYTTKSGDLTLAGKYQLQAYVELPGWKGHGTIAEFKIKAILV